MSALPSTTRTLARGLLRRRPGLSGRSIPRLEAHASGITIDGAWLAAYREMTGSPHTDALPLMAPQLLAGPLHAQVLSHPEMPVGVLGLVHVNQQITQHRPVSAEATLELAVWLEGHRPAKQGAELDIHTRLLVDGALAWEGTTSALARGPWRDETAPAPPGEPEPLPADGARTWTIGRDAGRRWRRVSGDPNPIHLSSWLARPFGFKAAIAHGTWTLARAAGELGEAPTGRASLRCRFRRPVFLPSEPSFRSHPSEDGSIRFELRDLDRDKLHLHGELSREA